MVIERRTSAIGGHSSEVEEPTSRFERRALVIGRPTLTVEAHTFNIEWATSGLGERTLVLERASLRSDLYDLVEGDAVAGEDVFAIEIVLRPQQEAAHPGWVC